MNIRKFVFSVVASLFVLGIISALVWALFGRVPLKPAHFAKLIDYSDSRSIDCGLLDRTIREVALSPRVMSKSHFFLFSTGDENSSDEPVLLGKYRIPVHLKVLEGKGKGTREVDEMIDNVKKRCEQEPVKKRSPIALAMMRVVENMRTNGCSGGSGCKMFVETDGEELSEVSIKNALRSSKSRPANEQIAIPNDGIAVEICGFAQVTKSKGKPHSLNDLGLSTTVWKSLFTHPDLVVVVPHCS